MRARVLLTLGLLLSFVADAATTSWRAYDLKNCKRWSLTDDVPERGPRYDKAKQLADTRNTETDEGNRRWFIVEGGILWEGGEPSYGVCRFESDSTVLFCLPEIDFPLAGAAYKLADGEGGNTYLCSRGCEKTEIKLLIEEAYEEETVLGQQAVRLIQKFEDLCHDEEKRQAFYERLNSSKKKVN